MGTSQKRKYKGGSTLGTSTHSASSCIPVGIPLAAPPALATNRLPFLASSVRSSNNKPRPECEEHLAREMKRQRKLPQNNVDILSYRNISVGKCLKKDDFASKKQHPQLDEYTNDSTEKRMVAEVIDKLCSLRGKERQKESMSAFETPLVVRALPRPPALRKSPQEGHQTDRESMLRQTLNDFNSIQYAMEFKRVCTNHVNHETRDSAIGA